MAKFIRRFLQHPIAFHRCYVQFGGVSGAVFLSQAMYWQGKKPEGEWFYKTAEEWEEETGLTRKMQAGVRAELRDKGILKEKRQQINGVPILHYQIDEDQLEKLILESENPRPTGISQKVKLEGDERSSCNFTSGEKPYKESETTTETTDREVTPLPPSHETNGSSTEDPTEETIRRYTQALYEELACRGTSPPSGKWAAALFAAYQELGPDKFRNQMAIFSNGTSRNLDDFARGFRKPPQKSYGGSRAASQGGSAPKFLREQRSAPVPQECQPPPEAIAWNKRVQPEHRWRAWDNSLDALWREATGNMNGHFGEWLDACEKLSPGALKQDGSFGSAFTLEKALQRWPKFVNGNYDWLAKGGGVDRGKGNSLLSQQSNSIKAAIAEMLED